MIHTVFRWCVVVLEYLAHHLGTNYEAVNVWVFVVIWPLITIALVARVVWLGRKVRVLRHELGAGSGI